MLSRLVTLVMSIFLLIAAGTANYYPLYLSGIMKKYSYSEKQVNLYGSFINLGYWLTLPLGFLYDKYGPGISLIVACILLPGSYTMLNLIITMIKTNINIILMIILGFIMGQGSALCYISALATNLQNFSKSANVISGILITNLAISPSLFTSYESAMKNKSKNDYEFIVFIGLILAAIIAIGAWLVQVQDNEEEVEETRRNYLLYKEQKICEVFVGLNIFTLFLFVFGIIYNNRNSTSKFPVAFLLPLVQIANIIMIILEKCEVWDIILMKRFVKNEIKKKLNHYEEKYLWSKLNTFKSSTTATNDAKSTDFGNELKNTNNNFEKSKNIHQIKKNEEDNKNPQEEIKKEPDKVKDKKNEEDKVCIDDGSEKAILDSKKMNLSFDFEKRINDLKVKYELNSSLDGPNNFYNKKKIDEDITKNTNNNKGTHEEEIGQGLGGSLGNNLFTDGAIHSSNNSNFTPNINNNISQLTPKAEKREGYIETISSNRKTTCECENRTCNLFFSPDLIMITFIMMFGIGSSVSVNHNIGLILQSISPSIKPGKISDYSIIYFAFDSFSRLASGLILNPISKRNLTKEYLLLISFIGMISQLIGLSLNAYAIYATVILTGIVNGLSMTFIPMFVKENNEPKDFGKILATIMTGVAVGTMLISDFLFRAFYDMFKEPNTGKCEKIKCFIFSFAINAIFFLINIILCVFAICSKNKKLKEIEKTKEKE